MTSRGFLWAPSGKRQTQFEAGRLGAITPFNRNARRESCGGEQCCPTGVPGGIKAPAMQVYPDQLKLGKNEERLLDEPSLEDEAGFPHR